MVYYSDIDLTLEKDQSGDIKKVVDVEAVKNSIRNIAQTIQGHRVMVPEFALNAYNLLFDPVGVETAQELGEIMWDSIQTWDNRIKIENVHVSAKPDRNRYEISIYFYVENISEDVEEVTLALNQL